MVEAGIEYVRIGEFMWSVLEPSPGVMDWSLLDKSVEVSMAFFFIRSFSPFMRVACFLSRFGGLSPTGRALESESARQRD
jgi:hypothetical protein